MLHEKETDRKSVRIVGSDVSDEVAELLEGSGFVVERVESVESARDAQASQDPAVAALIKEVARSAEALVRTDYAYAEPEDTPSKLSPRKRNDRQHDQSNHRCLQRPGRSYRGGFNCFRRVRLERDTAAAPVAVGPAHR